MVLPVVDISKITSAIPDATANGAWPRVSTQKQVSELSEQSERSMREAQTYALTNGLGLQGGCPP